LWCALPLLLAAVPLTGAQYRWGDAPSFATEAWDAPGWTALQLAGHPPGRTGEWLWERLQLPEPAPNEPALMLDAVFGRYELYVDGVKIHSNPPDGLDAKGLYGAPPTLVRLPAGKLLALRIYTWYPLAGIRGVPRYGEHAELHDALVAGDVGRLVTAGLLLTIGLLGVIVLLPRRRLRQGAGFVLFAFAAAVYVAYYTALKDRLVPLTPGLWVYLWTVSLGAMSAGFVRFVCEMLTAPPRALLRWRPIQELAAVGFALTSAAGWIATELEGPKAEWWSAPLLFWAGTVLRVVMLAGSALIIWKLVVIGRTEGPDRTTARILLAGLALLAFATCLNIVSSVGLVPSSRAAYVPLGLFAMTLSLAVLVERAWTTAQLQAAQYAREAAERAKEKEAMLRDLHDGIGGTTTHIRLLAELGKRDGQKAMEALTAIAELSNEGLAELRAFIQALDESEQQVTWPMLCAELRRFGGQLIEAQGKTFNLEAKVPDEGRPPSALTLAVVRIFREALTNVVKHAAASRVDVQVEVDAGRLSLVIRDDGHGTGAASGGAPKGLDTGRGMANMRARAREVGGELTVTSEAGLTLQLEVPLPRNSPAAGDVPRA
jgi:signal transduction histidine kinase